MFQVDLFVNNKLSLTISRSCLKVTLIFQNKSLYSYLTIGYADDRGPVCFSCTQQQTLDSCNTIKLCGRDEVKYLKHYFHEMT